MADIWGTPRTRALAAALRRELEESGYRVREVARVLGLSHTTISQWQNGRRVPSPDHVSALLAVIRVTGKKRKEILDMAHNAADPNWLAVGAGMSNQLGGLIDCEQTATEIIEWTPWLITGLLQMPAYVRAIVSSFPERSADEIDRVVGARIERQRVLRERRPAPARLTAFIGEPGIRQVIGGRTTMIDQLDYLMTVSRLSNVQVRIVPIATGWHPGLTGPFLLYNFPRLPSILHLEHHRSSVFLYDREQIEDYRVVVAWLDRVALSGRDSAAMITDAIGEVEYEQQPLAQEQPE
ncbi:helix-turn-helix domain-containing protein [Actinokineospora sp.]|uniref:helix-turn-helix domain-containing protein n=1 Tax=Actinokineospora sp. TaxID=1872133 RepID=UPI004037C6A8